MNSGQELKIINDKNIVPNIDAIIEYYETTKFWDYYLQPMWDEKNGPNIDETVKTILKCNEKKYQYDYLCKCINIGARALFKK